MASGLKAPLELVSLPAGFKTPPFPGTLGCESLLKRSTRGTEVRTPKPSPGSQPLAPGEGHAGCGRRRPASDSPRCSWNRLQLRRQRGWLQPRNSEASPRRHFCTTAFARPSPAWLRTSIIELPTERYPTCSLTPPSRPWWSSFWSRST